MDTDHPCFNMPWKDLFHHVIELEKENAELRKDATEVLVKKMHMEHGEFELSLESNPLLKVLGEWAMGMLKDAPNFVTTLLVHAPSGEGVILTFQRQFGESPAQQLARYKAENAELRARLGE